MDRWKAVLIAVGVGLFAIACGSSPTQGGAPATGTTAVAPTGPAKVGDRVEQGGIALTVVKVERKAELDQFQKAKAGNVFLVAEVLLENTGTEKAPYNPFYFTVKDADGFEVNAALTAGEGALKSGDLVKGDKARGVVAFEVKQAAKGLVLSYKPLVFGADEAIRVALN